MPSPFPGMDPYLEDPTHWANVHHALISACRELLNEVLRPKYVARVEERVYLSPEDDPARELYRVPDLRIDARRGRKKPATTPAGGASAIAPLVLTTLPEEEVHEYRIEVQAVGTKAVVTVIEILSPSNKVAGSEGRNSFLAKRREVTSSKAHWVEIDLLRAGLVLDARRSLPRHEYCAHVSPAGLRPRGRVWPIRLRDRLPEISVPLRPPDPDAPLDLQRALDLGYDRAALDLTVDYRKPPVPPLPPDLAAWARDLLRGKGLR
jgi:hypothetical protein